MAGRKSNKPITDQQVAAHRFVEGKSPFLWDHGTGAVSRFGVRATPAGGKQFVIRYAVGRRQRQYSLGPVEKFETVDQARSEARALVERLNKKGIDPAVGRDGSMQAVWDHYISGLRSGRGRTKGRKGKPASPRTIEVYEQQWKTHMQATIGPLAPSDVNVDVVAALHDAVSNARTVAVVGRGGRKRGGLVVANRVVAALQAAWRANSRGLTRDLPDPFKALERNAESVRRVTLRRADLPAFMAAIRQEPAHLKAYWQLMLLTGARGGELRGLLWDDVDLKNKSATFRDVKNGEPTHEISLSPPAAAVLRNLPRAGARVFPFDRPRASWERILKRAGLSGIRPHDVRRTVGSWLGAAGLSSKAVGAFLGHKSDVTSRVYIQLSDDQETKRTAAEMLAKLSDKVVSIEKARAKRQAAKRTAKAGAA